MKKFPAILAFAFAALTLVGEAFDFDAKFKQAQNGDATAQNANIMPTADAENFRPTIQRR